MSHQMSIFGIVESHAVAIKDITDAGIWVMDPKTEYLTKCAPSPIGTYYRVRGWRMQWAVPPSRVTLAKQATVSSKHDSSWIDDAPSRPSQTFPGVSGAFCNTKQLPLTRSDYTASFQVKPIRPANALISGTGLSQLEPWCGFHPSSTSRCVRTL